MGLIDKLKLLFKIKQPVGEIVDAVKEAKASHKWFHFSVVLIGTLATSAGALAGYVNPTIQLVVVSALQAIYNILRGADKAESAEIKGTLRTTEFWMSGLSELQKMFVALHTGGIDPAWMTTCTALVGATLSFGQNLAARAPIDQNPATETK